MQSHGFVPTFSLYMVQKSLRHCDGILSTTLQETNTAMLLAAHRAVGTTLFWRGVLASAQTHFAQVIALYDPKQHRISVFQNVDDPGVFCLSRGAWVLWLLGYPHQALARSHEAMTLAQQLAYPFNLSF